jgi:hypothetical protein
MRFVKFDAMEIIPDKDGETLHCRKYITKVNPDLVCSISPIMIPGNISGPGGQPIPIEGTRILFGATSVIVTTGTDLVESILTGSEVKKDVANQSPKLIKFNLDKSQCKNGEDTNV